MWISLARDNSVKWFYSFFTFNQPTDVSLNLICVFAVLLAETQTPQLSVKSFISVREFMIITATMMNSVILQILSLVAFIRCNISEKQGGGAEAPVAEVYFNLDWSSCGVRKKKGRRQKKRGRRKVRFCESHV